MFVWNRLLKLLDYSSDSSLLRKIPMKPLLSESRLFFNIFIHIWQHLIEQCCRLPIVRIPSILNISPIQFLFRIIFVYQGSFCSNQLHHYFLCVNCAMFRPANILHSSVMSTFWKPPVFLFALFSWPMSQLSTATHPKSASASFLSYLRFLHSFPLNSSLFIYNAIICLTSLGHLASAVIILPRY